ncbi:MAG: type II secretion system F family protein [Candidatus Pacebacteria bacterium]|nr:type II secretion system F family protein [Candidatus Paceibacterota bacterium]NUQ56996.1 type II secretion system F family protein [Candidatus Paceibacter sp.]
MIFEYKAKKISGEDTGGEIDAGDKFEAAHKLRERGEIPVSIIEKGKKGDLRSLLAGIGFISAAEKIMFSKNLGVMISAGLPLARALEILSRQTKNKVFAKIIAALLEDAKKGVALSEAMKKRPGTFSKLFTAMVRTGEESGRLSDSLKTAGQQMEKDYILFKKIRGAMIYPCVILLAMLGIGAFMFVYVVPTLVSTFKDMNMELPLSTKVIIFISETLTGHTILFLAVLVFILAAAVWFLRSENGRKALGFLMLNAPIISPVAKKLYSARTSRTLSSLVSSGINIVEALTITKDVLQNSDYKKILNNAIEDVQKGVPISNAFKQAPKYYPVMVGEMMAVGEETGKVGEMLERVASFYEDEVAEATKNITTIIEPFLMLLIGGAVGFFALSMIRPMYSVMNGI